MGIRSLLEYTRSRSSLSPYRDKEWAKDYWREFYEVVSNSEFSPFVMWQLKEYHGVYINISGQGIRKTWNLDREYHGSEPKLVYAFGSSTLWGTGARDDFTIPSYLSRVLNNGSYGEEGFTVYNFGDAAYTFLQEVIRLTLLLREGHKPDYAIFYDGIADLFCSHQCGFAGAVHNELVFKKRMQGATSELIWFGIQRLLSKAAASLGIYRIPYFPKEVGTGYNLAQLRSLGMGIVSHYRQTQEMLDKLSQTYGFGYLCLWHPSVYTEDFLTDEEIIAATPRVKDEAFRSLCQDVNGMLPSGELPHFYNITDVLKDRDKTLYIDQNHICEEGNAIVASRIASIFEKEFLH